MFGLPQVLPAAALPGTVLPAAALPGAVPPGGGAVPELRP